MITNITSLTGNGLKDWLIQRISSFYLSIFFLWLLIYFITHSYQSYEKWHALLQCHIFQIASVLALLSFCLHAWIGIWTITTDYIKKTCTRITVQMLVLLYLSTIFIWGLIILWGH